VTAQVQRNRFSVIGTTKKFGGKRVAEHRALPFLRQFRFCTSSLLRKPRPLGSVLPLAPGEPSIPILVLTGRNRVEDRVQCLDLGADDYLGKPFSFTELSARIRALMRRSRLPVESVLAVDDLKLDRVERRVERAGRRIELTSKEFCLLEYLMRNAGRRIPRAIIIEHVWNLSFNTSTNVVDVYVNYLRRKMDDGYSKHLIHTIRGVGYELSARPHNEPSEGSTIGPSAAQ
jgi:DNA-binding winged helix-turn-helix (wHTH) protein